MKKYLLDLLRCNNCYSDLLFLENSFTAERNEIMSGKIICKNCGYVFLARNGILSMHIKKNSDIDKKTANKTRKSYNFLWSRNELEKSRGTDDLATHFDTLSKLISFHDLNDKVILDVGCGNGSDLLSISKRFPQGKIIGVDITDEGVKQAFSKVGFLNGSNVLQADIGNLPFKNEIFDLVYSYGVLHHTSNAKDNFLNLVNMVKKNGMIVLYLYEKFNERSIFEKYLLKAVNSLRFFTTRMNAKLLYGMCFLLSPLVFIVCVLPFRLFNRLNFMKVAFKIPFRHCQSKNPFSLTGDLYDRFSVQIEERYSKNELQQWCNEAGLKDVNFYNLRGWVFSGVK